MITTSDKRQAKSEKKEAGFTLVELLASIIVLVVVGIVVSGITTSTLRGTNKASTIENIRQNGNYALSQISKTIQYAQTFNGLSIDGINYVTSCPFSDAPIPTPVRTPFNFIKVTPNNNISIVYECTSFPPDASSFTKDGVSVINTNSVKLRDCSIFCTQTRTTDVPIIGISLNLEPLNSTGLVENSTPPTLFETSVTLRNYK